MTKTAIVDLNEYMISVTYPFGPVINSLNGNPVMEVSCSALPITLSTFSATKHSDRASKLDWKTSSEINSAYFGIERSRDGDTWETIGKVAAAGNSHTELTYEYIDDNLPFSRTADQIYYYRLRLTDQDGTHKYSDIKAVNFSRKTSDGIAIYPNPSTQMVHLDISTMDASAGDIDLRIYDIHGRIMADKQIIGAGIEPIDVTQYPTGTYQVSVTQGTTQHQKRFIKIE
ncbi:MAG: T9SS type A sorting domain-containing protein [Saprospiraceae bacterium]|nr:T9SS type A sorting domain-containing protein [Saprospiraceae bacterium]